MTFVRPTPAQILERVEGDLKSELDVQTLVRRSFLKAIASALAGASHTLHGHINFATQQIFPDQAADEFLDRWGSIFGLERNPATFASQTIDIVFTGAGTVTAGTIYQRVDGVEYTLDADVTATAAGTLQGVITAEVAGSNANNEVGDVVSLQSPIANVNGDATVAAITLEGEDRETDDSYRDRLVNRIQQPPAGGTPNDYIQFARTVTGVTRAWVFPGYLGAGTVGVSFVQDDEDPIIPGAAKVAEVQTAVDERKPVVADATVFAPTDNPLDLTIRLNPNTAAVREAVETELRDLISREAEVKGAFRDIDNTYTGKIPLSRINEAISIADGEEDHILVSPTVDAEPGANGGIITLGTITWLTLN